MEIEINTGNNMKSEISNIIIGIINIIFVDENIEIGEFTLIVWYFRGRKW